MEMSSTQLKRLLVFQCDLGTVAEKSQRPPAVWGMLASILIFSSQNCATRGFGEGFGEGGGFVSTACGLQAQVAFFFNSFLLSGAAPVG